MGRHKGKAVGCHPAQYRSQPPHFRISTENPRTACSLLFSTLRQKLISARNKCQSTRHLLPLQHKRSFYPLEGSARELLQFAFSAARLVKIRARSTQTPHKLGHIADRTAANSCPIHQGGGQEAYGDLQLRVRTFSENIKVNQRQIIPWPEGTRFLHTAEVSHRQPSIRHNAEGHSLHPATKHSPTVYKRDGTTKNIFHFLSIHVHVIVSYT